MRAIQEVIRELIVAAKKRGEKESDIALWMKVSKPAIAKIWKRYRDKGNTQAIKNSGRPPKMTKEKTAEVINTLKQTPDITLHEMIDELSLPIQKSQLSRLIKKLGYSFKKKRYIRITSSERMSSSSVQNGKKNKRA